ncbi:aminoglycoside phosphotransferase family protein [bacterium]|nr:MAG: aminoglycoside phosphotransferase family protein [bacterium]
MPNEQPQQDSIEVAQRILSQHFYGAVTLEAGATLRGSNRSHVVRCRVLQGPPNCPDSVVVKRALSQQDETYDPNSNEGPAMRLFNEWASLQFLSECFGEQSPIPRFYGGDKEAGVFVMQDLGAEKGLDVLLRADDATAAENALEGLFQVLGRMHAVSIGKASRYRQLREALGATQPGIVDKMADYANSFKNTLQLLGLEPHPQLEAELDACVQMVLDPGPFAALIHCDPCPDNCLVTSQGVRLLDFELSQFGLALWDGAYVRSHFPTCWCVNRIPQQMVEKVEAIYRTELTRGCPQAADDKQFGMANVAGCACALFLTIRWGMPGLLEQDDEWGIATNRQRVLVRLDALARATERWQCFPVLGASARQLEAVLKAAWLPEMEEMRLYPAFRH